MSSDALTGQTVLVTGGAGFVGSHIAAALTSDNEVRVLDSLETGSRSNVPEGATLIEGDIRDERTLAKATEDVNLIFHEAARISVQESIEAPMESHSVNATGTLAVLEQARSHGARVVLASSAAIYGHPEQVPVAESDATTPMSPYGLQKLTLDHYARQYHDLYGLETVALRYFNIYGPRQGGGDYSGVVSIFLDRALAGEEIPVHGDGEQTRDFVFIDDVVRANLEAARTDSVGRSYNIGTGDSITIRELAEQIVEVTGSSSDIVHTEGRSGDIRHSEADISRAESKLGYEPAVSLQDGLAETVEWFQH